MAKSLRASVKKANRSKLRTRVFNPTIDARTERLSAKLVELASQPKAPRAEMEVDEEPSKSGADKHKAQESGSNDDMMLDDIVNVVPAGTISQSISEQKKSRVQKQKRRHKPGSKKIVFKQHPMKAKLKAKAGKR
ncbi:hypothetical protein M501DRAFT_1014277 [Patellaria atrata CBS 101060]|uniref:DUF2423 domain-containing protein n=1 Tax=Patellaria atrata CBS 101060 TaxID=1346257 RepID=A0A9P4SGP5_9PEZI|nr:hypothetical protein M501DRAFT_1014277 [Patellaria atrata CBS 101060]